MIDSASSGNVGEHIHLPFQPKPPTRTIGVVGIGSEEKVGAQFPHDPPLSLQDRYRGPEFGDVRDVLVQAPQQAYADLVPSYVCSDIFPRKLEVMQEYVKRPVSVLEIGAFYGHFLLTCLEAFPETMRYLFWADNEQDAPNSNLAVKENISWWAGAHLGEEDSVKMKWASSAYEIGNYLLGVMDTAPIDIVHVDGNHQHEAAISDITLALALQPKLVIVDDTAAHAHIAVRNAVEWTEWNTGLTAEYFDTVNGFAVFRPHQP